MSRPFRIAEVKLNGCDLPHVWDFPSGVTVIVGAVGGGKTSLLNLIKFGLGGSAPITKDITDAAKSVTLDVHVGARRLTLTREFPKANFVMAGERDEASRRYDLRRQSKHPWLSDLLLEALDIPALQVRQARGERSKSRKITSISFEDVLAYCYLDQDQVDRSTVYDDDTFRGPKRLWTFELLHGFIDREVAALEVTSQGLREETEKRETRIAAVESFVKDRGLVLQPDAIANRLTEITLAEQRLTREFDQARTDASRAIEQASASQEQVRRVEEQLADARIEHLRVATELEGVRRAANQLERDLAAIRDASEVRDTLDTLSYVACPRCEQKLDARHPQDGTCVVCLQPDPPQSDVDLEAVGSQIAAQLDETQELETRLASAETIAATSVVQLTTQLQDSRQEIQRHIEEASAPYIERSAQLQEELGALRGERRPLMETQPVAVAVRTERQELQASAPEIALLEDRAEQRRSALAAVGSERVAELSKAFDEILRRFTLPWLETAEVDPDTYLPKVNGRGLRELSSGGMKATTNVAYYLAILVTALRDRDVLTPNFMMLDSVRKDYGAGDKDLARAERIYDYFRTLQVMRTTQGALSADFQLIVVDNDLPPAFTSTFNTIPIDPDRPLIRKS